MKASYLHQKIQAITESISDRANTVGMEDRYWLNELYDDLQGIADKYAALDIYDCLKESSKFGSNF